MAVLIEYNIKLALCPYNILCCICRVFSDEVAKINKGGYKKLYRVTPIAIYLWPYKEQAAIGYKLPAEQVYSQPRVQKTLYYTVLYMQHSMHVRIYNTSINVCMQLPQSINLSSTNSWGLNLYSFICPRPSWLSGVHMQLSITPHACMQLWSAPTFHAYFYILHIQQ